MSGRPGRDRPGAVGPTTRCGSARRARLRDDRGMVTAELAVGLPALVVVLAVALFAQAAVTAQLRCVDAAAVAARLLARGESGALARSTALAAAPSDATLVTGAGPATSGAQATVTTVRAQVRATVHPLLGWLPGIPVAATVVEPNEPSLPASPP